MNITLDEAISELERLEPVFIAAGDVIADMQELIFNGHKHHDKTSTGNAADDIVTEADFLSQEMILSQLVKTKLAQARLFAEEDTVLTDAFATESPYYITLDPLDGTKRFTENNPVFSVIIQLHDKDRPQYTFIYYPRFKYWMRMVKDTAETSGPLPAAYQTPRLAKTIISSQNYPSEGAAHLVEKLHDQGLDFLISKELPTDFGSNLYYLTGDVAGYFAEHRNIYDGGVAYHSALVRGHKLIQQGYNESSIKKTPRGLVYGGFILALNPTHVPADTLASLQG